MENRKLSQVCGAFRAKLKTMLFGAGLSRVILLAVILMAVLFAMDWWANLARPWRAIALLLFIGAIGTAFWFSLILPLRRRWTDREVLSYIDAVLPQDQAMLLDLYELTQARDQIQEASTPTGQSLVDAAVDELASMVDRVQLSGTLRRKVVLNWATACGVALAVVLGLLAVQASRQYVVIGAIRLFNPLSTLRWPHNTTINLDSVPDAMPQLESLTVEGTVTVLTGDLPSFVIVHQRTQGSSRFETMPAVPVVRQKDEQGHEVGRFSYTFARVRDPLEFFVVGGDYDTEWKRIGIISRPYIEEVSARLSFPAYAGIPNRTESNKQLRVLEGTGVSMQFKCNMPLKEAWLVPLIDKDDPAATQPDAEPRLLPFVDDKKTVFQWDHVARDNVNYTIELKEVHGFKQAGEERIGITVDRDKPPTVRMLSPSADLVQTNKASVDVMIQAEDDYGIKTVQLVYQLDGGPEIVLDDKISGLDGPPKGKRFQHRFNWPLRLSAIPDKGRLVCFVRVKDVNPIEDRGWAESDRAMISLVRPTEFHLAVLEQAKGLLNEARLTWLHQLRAYNDGLAYLEKGTGESSDPVWLKMQENQATAISAARAMRTHLRWLTEQYERNQMAREFMSPRLVQVAGLINQLIDEEHKSISEGLAAARPMTTAEGEPARQLERRRAGLGKFGANQKFAVLLAEQIIIKLYDWNDLQLATVTTTLMAEQQEELIPKTEAVTVKYIGLQPNDLTDLQFEELLTLGKAQRAIFDSETQLERQMDELIFRARMQKRQSVLSALWAAWTVLRENRVNDKLKDAAAKIENNQPSQVLSDQKQIVQLLRLVESGLIAAGARIEDAVPRAVLAQADVRGEVEFDPVRQVQQQEDVQGGETVGGTRERIDDPPPVDGMLAAALRRAHDLQDDVRGRLFYLAENKTSAEMPRFVRLKELMLVERQAVASAGVGETIEIANDEKEKASEPVRAVLAGHKDEVAQLVAMIGARDTGKCHRQAQEDLLGGIKDVLYMLDWEKQIELSAADKKSGQDAFGRPFVIRGPDLDSTVGMIARLSHALALERSVVRKLSRFASAVPEAEPAVGLEKTNRTRAAAAQKLTGELVDAVTAQAASMSTEVGDYVSKTGVPALAELKLGSYVDPIAKGGVTAEQIGELKSAEESMLACMQSLRDLMAELVPPPPPPPVSTTAPEYLPPPEPGEIAVGLDGSGIPAPMIERMKRALEKGDKFPDRYDQLLRAYYSSFTRRQMEQAGEGGQGDNGATAPPTPPEP